MRWLIRLLGLLVLVAALVVGSVFFLPGDRLARIASDQLSAQLGRKVEIGGDVTFSLYPVLGISTGPVSVANAAWAGADAPPLFAANSAHIGLEALPLLRRDVRVKALYADQPRIVLQQLEDGRANWIFSDAATDPATTSQSAIPAISIEDLAITGGSVTLDFSGAETQSLRNVDLALSWPEPSGPADLSVTLRPAGPDVTVEARLPKPLGLFSGEAQAISAVLRTNGGTAQFTGNASLAPSAQGKLTAEFASTRDVLAALGLGAAELPRGLGQTISLDTSLTLTEAQVISFNGLQASLDQNDLRGAFSVDFKAKPRISGQLDAGALDLRALTAGGEDKGSASSGWSTEPIDASALGLVDGSLGLRARSVDLGTLKFGQARVDLNIDRSRAVFTVHELAGYQGAFSGEFVMNNRNGLSVGGKLRGAGVEAKDLLTDLAGVDRLSGKADTEIQFLGVGQSLATIVSSLEGSGRFGFGRGVISGIDLDKLMRSGDGTGGTTIFDRLTASYKMHNGVLKNDDLVLELPVLRASGEGRVNLGAQTLDYTFTPKLLGTETRQGLAIPVQIKGPWSGPRISADIEKAIDLNFKDEKEAAEEEIRKRVGDELGVEIDEKDSVEDIIKKKVEDEILKGIGGLLGGN